MSNTPGSNKAFKWICKHGRNHLIDNTVVRLAPEVCQQVRKLSLLAAEGLEKRQFIFDNISCDHMGLMQSAEEELVIGSTVSYCFLHLTLQEYLAALHWSKMDSKYLVSETHLHVPS